MQESENRTTDEPKTYAGRVWTAAGIVAAIVILLLFLWSIATTLLVIFGGILLALFLRGLSGLVSDYTPLPDGWSLAAVGLGLLGLVALGGWLLAPPVADQFDRLFEELPRSLGRIESSVASLEVGQQILEAMPEGNRLLPNGSNLMSRAAGLFSTTMGKVTNLVIIIFTGIYLAVEPNLYRNGLLRLVPRRKRRRVGRVLAEVGHQLQKWLIGRLFSMIVIGVLTTVGLWLLGMPVALSLGLFAAVVTFVPYIGPIVSVIPAVLLALLQGPTMVLYVLLLYLGIQFVESYLLTPLVQQEAVSMPPVLTITGQIVLGVIFGLLGLIFATPLVAAAMVLVKRFYVEDTLNDSFDEPVCPASDAADEESKSQARAVSERVRTVEADRSV